jgi:uncharacterized protein
MRENLPDGVPCWIDTDQPDPGAAMRFYGDLFGWTFSEEGPGYHLARLDGADVAGLRQAEAAAWNTYVRTPSADAAADRARAAGGRVLTGPRDVPGGRTAALEDPEGARIAVWEPHGHPGAEAVNRPGTWNWSNLRTADLPGAEAFYGAVFPWRFSRVDLGPLAGAMVQVPDYGEYLESIHPGTLARHREHGAPPGFSDCVCWFETGGPGPDWHVSFATDDADRVAERAVALGGEVVVAPHDVPMVRTTTLRDPGGATFTAAHFRPE